jgi:hypothetical protein
VEKNKNVTNSKNVSTEKWGDSEHDTRLHKNLKPHKGKPEYDPNYKTYKD